MCLIDKVALYDAMTEEYKKHYAGTGKGYDFTIAMQMVQNQPTTTEAEIRAKAIDEFAEAVVLEIECFAREMDGEPNCGFIGMCIDIANNVAEQLKEE
jgi:hypothetical protein